ncbi:MAG: single-stranded-DNA-specific exonuclease RecJ [Ruminococcus sp.]|jgi:single-stranded-DNA-specific exonuclease|nr:single-stranded-DNA-specific exonuclease RecJ [Ruminococcus sp.]
MKKWTVKKPDPAVISALTGAGVKPIAAEVFAANGITDVDSAKSFFGDGKLSDPFSIIDMEAAVKAINDIVFEKGERVCVYGDYDCDGVCAAVLLYTFFESNGADVTVRINSREEGFGLNSDVIREIGEDGVKLIITVDNGISAAPEAALIKSLGMSLIITDHHEPTGVLPGEDFPLALAIVDPHREENKSAFIEYCGCGVALMLVAALMGDVDAALEQFSDIAALATVADMVKLNGENRTIVNHGLHYFEHTENLGLQELIKVSGIKPPITASHFGFYLGPRINAAGRVAHAKTAFDLLVCEDSESAEKKAFELNELNTERKKVQADLIKQIEEDLKKDPSPLYRRILVLRVKDAPHGVVGLAAGKILETAGKPVFLMTDDEGGILRGSARSFPGYSVVDALNKTSELLTKFGGHPLAGGFSLKAENFEKFADALEDFAKECNYNGDNPEEAVKILTAADLTIENAKEISALEPFGQGFERPLFILSGAEIKNLVISEKNVKVTINLDNNTYYFNVYKTPPENFSYVVGDKIDILTYFGISSWQGQERLEFEIEKLKLSGVSQLKMINGINAYEAWKRGEYPDRETLARVLPSREDFEALYNQLKSLSDRKIILTNSLLERNHAKFNSFKLLLILDIFEEAGLLENSYFDGTVVFVKNPPKTSLEETGTMKLLTKLLHTG